ncbi:hypothetical protein [Paenibacillus alginolyticus]|uniref:Uncharacterized protein n=1 Tax=Paenibacillus alginolyticus TaxID=59839 RepID=A0ABT4GGW6_9BACL|nr:hypothetical protein [Paenibacillus alginolyticus]MCY9695446.1 hypothetical protein [Paenibacillus alginolyticus]MEC0146307.1 hypothetical protein [Paenibacillus alginolyticus]
MKWGAIVGISVIVALMVLYEWPKMDQKQMKEKAALLALSGVGFILAILLVFFPDMPGPTDLVNMIYKPFGQILEK